MHLRSQVSILLPSDPSTHPHIIPDDCCWRGQPLGVMTVLVVQVLLPGPPRCMLQKPSTCLALQRLRLCNLPIREFSHCFACFE